VDCLASAIASVVEILAHLLPPFWLQSWLKLMKMMKITFNKKLCMKLRINWH